MRGAHKHTQWCTCVCRSSISFLCLCLYLPFLQMPIHAQNITTHTHTYLCSGFQRAKAVGEYSMPPPFDTSSFSSYIRSEKHRAWSVFVCLYTCVRVCRAVRGILCLHISACVFSCTEDEYAACSCFIRQMVPCMSSNLPTKD